jgi:hypothetical protein
MAMLIRTEAELANEATRKKLIERFDDAANQRRKAEAFMAYECLKDRTSTYVAEALLKQFEPETVDEMQMVLTNISVLRKVIDKLAKVYALGVKRTLGEDEADTSYIEDAAKYLKMNAAMKKANRYYRAFKNTLAYVKPVPAGNGLFDIKIEILPPFKYDVVENPDNPAGEPLAIVVSDYVPSRKTLYAIGDAAAAGRGGNVRVVGDDATLVKQHSAPTTNVRANANKASDVEDKDHAFHHQREGRSG